MKVLKIMRDIILFLHEVFVTCSCYTPLSPFLFFPAHVLLSHRGKLAFTSVSNSEKLRNQTFLIRSFSLLIHTARSKVNCVIFFQHSPALQTFPVFFIPAKFYPLAVSV